MALLSGTDDHKTNRIDEVMPWCCAGQEASYGSVIRRGWVSPDGHGFGDDPEEKTAASHEAIA